MKNLLWILAASLLLAACSGDEPAQPAADTVPATEEAAEAPEVADAAVTAGEEQAVQVVEESASEPEPEEQAILLAQAEVPAVTQDWKFSEGKHYHRMVPTQPTYGGADKIEVAEFFWYGCPHCYDFEPFINRWNADKPANVRFVRIPAMWNGALKLHAQLYYTEQVLVRNGNIKDGPAFREAVFQEYHRRGNRLMSEGAIQKLFARFDVSADEFSRAWNSFEVAQNLLRADDLARRYSVANVPTVVVNGKYRTGGGEAGSFPALIDVINELIARESVR